MYDKRNKKRIMEKNKISRRDFLKKSGALLAATAVPSFLSAEDVLQGKQVKLKSRKVQMNDAWDVIVVGGGPAGCTAAIAAAREGAKTLLVEATGQLGGMGTTGMIPAWCPFSDGEKIIYRGLAEKVFMAAKKGVPHEPKDKLDWVSINPEQLMNVYDEMVSSSGAQILFFSRLAAVEMASEDTIDAIIVANKSGLTAFKAKVFIDCTGDGDLSVWAGAHYFMGSPKSDVQLSTLCFSVANVDPYAYVTSPNLYWENQDSPIHAALKSGKYPLIDKHCCNNQIGPSVVQFNAGHIALEDTTDPWKISEAMIQGRKVAQEYLRMFKDYQPNVYGNAFIVKTASLLGVRESRRIEGDYIFTIQDWLDRKSFDDEIGRNCYFVDVHASGYVPKHYQRGESHGIPYRILTPKGIKNLLTAGRCISADEEALGSLRVMPPSLVTGEAAGLAAALSIKQSRNDVHKVDTDYLRKRLREEGQYFL